MTCGCGGRIFSSSFCDKKHLSCSSGILILSWHVLSQPLSTLPTPKCFLVFYFKVPVTLSSSTRFFVLIECQLISLLDSSANCGSRCLDSRKKSQFQLKMPSTVSQSLACPCRRVQLRSHTHAQNAVALGATEKGVHWPTSIRRVGSRHWWHSLAWHTCFSTELNPEITEGQAEKDRCCLECILCHAHSKCTKHLFATYPPLFNSCALIGSFQ